MPYLFGRRIEVSVADLEISEPRISLSLERYSDHTQDRGEVAIYNLGADVETRIYERGSDIRIRAGYPETVALLFDGSVQKVVRERDNLSRITRCMLGDKVHGAQILAGEFQKSYEGSVPVRQIVADICRDGFNLPHGPLDAIPADATFRNYFVATVPATAAMIAVLREVDPPVRWYESDGVIRFARNGERQSDAPIVRVSPETGLVDNPRVTDDGVEIEMLLNPQIVIGAGIELKSDTTSGSYVVEEMRHDADNWQSGRFVTWCDLRPVRVTS